MAITSAAGYIALLEDKGDDMKTFALKRLHEIVDEFWAEISENVNKIEILQEDTTFPNHKLAALLASKVYYHLGDYDDSLHFALSADELLDINSGTEYIEIMLSKCIDKYTALRIEQEQSNEMSDNSISVGSVDGRAWNSTLSSTFKRMEVLVDKMFDRCIELKQYRHVLGIAIETRRLDKFEKAILLAEDQEAMLQYAFRVVLTLTDSAKLRDKLLRVLVQIYTKRSSPNDSVNLCQCLVLINDPQSTAQTLEKLILQSEESSLLAYQIAFDLYENSTQHYLELVMTSLKNSVRLGPLVPIIQREAAVTITEKSENAATTTAAAAAVEATTADLSADDLEIKNRLKHLLTILPGDKVIQLHLQLLIRNNKTDLKLLERIKEEVRNSVMHNATVLANGILHCGTTSDQFLREHLTWLGKAVNWAKFTATATLGMIHKGHEKEALELMSAYLPKDASGSSGSVYTEGGGLYALGLIHAGHGSKIIDYLLNQCKEATAEPVRHGACLGLGLAAMGTGREDVYDQIKMNLYQDDAVAGEAAGIGMGLVMLASGSARAIEDLLGYAKETAHEKIIRGIALGIALVMYGKQEEADELIDTLMKDNDPILRWCSMATIAMAYCGTGSNQAVGKLLRAAVSDTNDDVRRWALTAIGFILFKNPDKVPSLVSLLAESYHPHLRYGAAMAIGIACAGTALKEASALLDTLIDGTVSFVRQGALIAQAMVLIQQNGTTCPKSIEFRERCLKLISDRHEDVMVKFGAIIARSIVDAGGCNMSISLQTRTGNANMPAAVGLLLFQNFWFWYPLTNFISMAFTPTAVVTLNKDLQMPKMQFQSNAKPSTFAYPPPLQVEKEKKREKVEAAILSITAKQLKREMEKKQKATFGSAASSAVKLSKTVEVESPAGTSKKVKAGVVEVATIEKKEKEPSFCLLDNPARVMRAQQRVLTFPDDCRYRPIKAINQGGFIIVADKRPSEKEDIVETVTGHGPVSKTGTGKDATGKSASGLTGSSRAGVEGEVDLDEETASGNPVNVHASTLGAFTNSVDLDELIMDSGELIEEDDDEEGHTSDEDEEDIEGMEDDEEMEDDAATTTTTEDEGNQSLSPSGNVDVTTPTAASKRSTRSAKKHGKGSQGREPSPPEAFQYQSENESEEGRETPVREEKPSSKEAMDVDKPDSSKKKSSGSKK